MKNLINLPVAFLFILLIGCQAKSQKTQDVIALHPENPNYFLYNGKQIGRASCRERV